MPNTKNDQIFINFPNLSFKKGDFSPILDDQQHFETT